MSIINCPSCNERISSQAMLCLHCGFKRGEASEDELKEYRRRELRERIYRLKMASYGVLTLFLAAFAWYWMETQGFQYRSSMGPYILLAIGALAYLVIRLYLYKAKSALRRLTPRGGIF